MKPARPKSMITFNPFKLIDGENEQASAIPAYSGPARDPFDAVPVRSDNAETRKDSQGCGQIRMRKRPGPGLMSRLAHRLGFYRDVRVNLDAHGSYYWSLIDGRRDLREIEQSIRAKFNLGTDESRKATLLFTKTLMIRHVLHLDLGARNGASRPAATEGNEHAE
jgi:hypothetical protein